jgi:hypothetical protein
MNQIQLWLYKERQILEEISGTLATNIVSVATLLGMLFMPLFPALLAGLTVYTFALELWQRELALVLAVVAGGTLELLGIVGTTEALNQYSRWRRGLSDLNRFIAASVVVLGYVVGVSGTVYLMHSLPTTMMLLGVAAPIFSVLFYTTRALRQERNEADERQVLSEVAEQKVEQDKDALARQQQLEDEERAYQRKQEQLAATREHKLKMVTLHDVAPATPMQHGATPKQQFETWVQQGNDPAQHTVEELATMFGVNRSTIWRWQK